MCCASHCHQIKETDQSKAAVRYVSSCSASQGIVTCHPPPAPAVRLRQQLQAGIRIQMRAAWWARARSGCTLEALTSTPGQQSPGLQGLGPAKAGSLSCCWRVTMVLFRARVGSTVLNFPGAGESTTVKCRQWQERSSQLGSCQCQAVSGLSFPGPGVPPSGCPRALDGAHGILRGWQGWT